MASDGKKAFYRFERQKAEEIKILTLMMQELTMYKAYKPHMQQFKKNLTKLIHQYNAMNNKEVTEVENIKI